MSPWRQLIEVARRTPGYVLGAPTRWLLRRHRPQALGDSKVWCLAHREPVRWPCREFADAAEVLAANPSWNVRP